jgi:hypothetical protein
MGGDETTERPVPRFLDRIGEKTSRKFLIAPVIAEAFAALAFAGAGVVGAVAIRPICFQVAGGHRLLGFVFPEEKLSSRTDSDIIS